MVIIAGIVQSHRFILLTRLILRILRERYIGTYTCMLWCTEESAVNEFASENRPFAKSIDTE